MATVRASDGPAIDYAVTPPTVDPGDGDATARDVVLVHGITENRHAWDPLVPMLAAHGYRVIAIDLRGHGESSMAASYDLGAMAGDLGSVIEVEQAQAALLIGHSLGGAVVSAYAAGGPCRGVVNVDQPLTLGGFKQALTSIESMLRGTPDECSAAVRVVFDQMVGPLEPAEAERVASLRRADQEVVLGVWDLVLSTSAADLDALVGEVAAAVTVPYLSLHGIDPGPEYAEWLTGLVPSATVEVWADHGHYPHLIDRERFVERLIAFDAR